MWGELGWASLTGRKETPLQWDPGGQGAGQQGRPPHIHGSPRGPCGLQPARAAHSVRPQAPLPSVGHASRADLSFPLWEMGRPVWLGPTPPSSSSGWVRGPRGPRMPPPVLSEPCAPPCVWVCFPLVRPRPPHPQHSPDWLPEAPPEAPWSHPTTRLLAPTCRCFLVPVVPRGGQLPSWHPGPHPTQAVAAAGGSPLTSHPCPHPARLNGPSILSPPITTPALLTPGGPPPPALFSSTPHPTLVTVPLTELAARSQHQCQQCQPRPQHGPVPAPPSALALACQAGTADTQHSSHPAGGQPAD